MSREAMTRRDMLCVLGVSAAGAALAGCGPAATPQVVKETVEVEKVVEATVEVEVEKVVTPTPAPEGPVTLEFWQPFGGIEGETLDNLTAMWNERNPNVQVTATFTPNITAAGTNPKFLAAALSGNPPDVFIHDGSTFSTSTNLNAFMVVDDLVAASSFFKPEDFYPWAFEKVTWGGHVYGLPLHTDARALFYNKTLLQEAGFSEPPKTLDELDAVAEALTVAEGDRFARMGFIPWTGNWFLIAWGWDFGVEVWDAATNTIRLNAPEMIAALEYEVGYAVKYGVNAIQNFVTGFGSGVDYPLVNGRVAMEINGNWMIAYLREYGPDLDYGIAPPPYPAGRSHMTWSGGFVVGVPQGSKHPTAAWDFVTWLAGPEAQGIYAERCEVLPTNIAAATAFAEKNAAQKLFIDLLPVSYIEPVIPEWSLAWDEHIAAEQAALFGQKTAQQALDDANAKVQAAIDARLAEG